CVVGLDGTAGLVVVDAFAAGRIALGGAWRFSVADGAISIRDQHGWLLYDRCVLRGRPGVVRAAGRRGAGAPAEARLHTEDDPVFDGLGFTESRPYFASIAIVGAFDRDRFAAAVEQLAAHRDAARLGGAALSRRGTPVRCLAATAP